MGHEPTNEIYLYDGIGRPWFSPDRVREHLQQWLPGIPVSERGDLLLDGKQRHQDSDRMLESLPAIAKSLASMRVVDPTREPGNVAPLKPEIDYEIRLFTGKSSPTSGVVYDGNDLQRLAYGMLACAERRLGFIHIWFTERLFGTLDENDRRYHLRAGVYGQPSIISSSGMAAAPARDRNYYLARRLGVHPDDPSMEESGGDHLQHGDDRFTKIAIGYAMQAVLYALIGEPFCDDPGCRLFNAHWQKQMLNAQLGEPDYCYRHTQILRAFGEFGPKAGEHTQSAAQSIF